MYNLGEINTLYIKRIKKIGAFIGNKHDEDEYNHILLPARELSGNEKVKDEVAVFVYKDHNSKYIATLRKPKILLGEVKYLEVSAITNIGCFANWGLEKELYIPYKEQTVKLEKGRHYLFALYIDKSERLCATMKIRDYLKTDSPYKVNDWVSGTVYSIHNIHGAFIAIDDKYDSKLDKKDMLGVIAVGEKIKARINSIDDKGRINLVLKDKGYLNISEDSNAIYEKVIENGGFLRVNDDTDPKEIKKIFNMSKSSFKKALGRLLKYKRIKFKDNGIIAIERGTKSGRKNGKENGKSFS